MAKKLISVISVILLLIFIGLFATYGMMQILELRYDPYERALVDVRPSTIYTCAKLNLAEDEEVLSYNITLTRDYIPKGLSASPFYHSGQIAVIDGKDEAAITASIKEAVDSRQRSPMVPAYMTADCTYIPAVQGNMVDIQKLTNDVIREFPGRQTFNITNYYIHEEDPNAQSLMELSEKVAASEILYSNGESIKVSEVEPVYDDKTGSVSINTAAVREKAKDISLMYDDVGKTTVSFNSTRRGCVGVNGGTWGTITDSLAEMDAAEEILSELEVSMNRVPVTKQRMSFQLPDTYIEVDKENQHVFVYKDGEMIMESDCVTGRPDRATPSGIYFISERMTDKTLRGPGYSSFVRRWMRLTNAGVGLHDASWRSRFGGDLYIRDGSHGCINLPKDFAYELYDWVGEQPEKVCVIVF